MAMIVSKHLFLEKAQLNSLHIQSYKMILYRSIMIDETGCACAIDSINGETCKVLGSQVHKA